MKDMADIDCFFYKIKSNRSDPDLISYWSDAHKIALSIRDAYDREVERKKAKHFFM